MSKADEDNFEEKSETIECLGVAEQLRFKEDFALLSSLYDLNLWISKMMSSNLAIYQEVVAAKIQEITKRKKLSVNDVLNDDDVLALLKQRDKELRKINAAICDAVVGVKKRSQTTDDLATEILKHLEHSDTMKSLAAKMKEMPETLKKRMNRKDLTLGILKKMLYDNQHFKSLDIDPRSYPKM